MIALLAALTIVQPAAGERALPGEPSDSTLVEAANKYIAALKSGKAPETVADLDFWDMGAPMSWAEFRAGPHRPISFADAAKSLEFCEPMEGLPRRYDSDGRRVFALVTNWKCEGQKGKYFATFFLEIAGSNVVAGRLTKNIEQQIEVEVVAPPNETVNG